MSEIGAAAVNNQRTHDVASRQLFSRQASMFNGLRLVAGTLLVGIGVSIYPPTPIEPAIEYRTLVSAAVACAVGGAALVIIAIVQFARRSQ